MPSLEEYQSFLKEIVSGLKSMEKELAAIEAKIAKYTTSISATALTKNDGKLGKGNERHLSACETALRETIQGKVRYVAWMDEGYRIANEVWRQIRSMEYEAAVETGPWC